MIWTALAALIVGGIAIGWASAPTEDDSRNTPIKSGFVNAGALAVVGAVAALIGTGVQHFVDEQQASQDRQRELIEAGKLYGNQDDWPEPAPAN